MEVDAFLAHLRAKEKEKDRSEIDLTLFGLNRTRD